MHNSKRALQILALGLLGFGLAWLGTKPLRTLASSITIPGITSLATSCGIGGGPITTSGTVNGQELTNAQSGTTYAILSTDCGKAVIGTNASAQAYSIAQAGTTGFPAGYYVDVQSAGAGTITITPATSTINGAATLAITTGQSARIISTGANYIALLGGGTGGGSTTGPGIPVYSGISPTLTGTVFFPIGGGVIASGTEASVNTPAPFAATISNFYVTLSAAVGMGNSVVFTWRKAGASQTLTCTVSGTGAGGTTCNDTTHSFSVAAGDLIDIQAVSSGTIVVTPVVLMTVQYGSGAGGNAATQPGVQSGSYLSCADATGSTTTYTCAMSPTLTAYTTNMVVTFVPQATNSGAATLNIDGLGAKSILDNVTGAAVSASELVAAARYRLTYNGTAFLKDLPTLRPSGYYTTDGINFFTGPTSFLATLPSTGSYSWINQGSATDTANGNGITLFAPSNASDSLNQRVQSISSNTSMIALLVCTAETLNFRHCGVEFRESATGKITTLDVLYQTSTGGGSVTLFVGHFSNSTTFTSSPYSAFNIGSGLIWLQLQVSGANLVYSYSQDGVHFIPVLTEAKTSGFTTGPDQWGYFLDVGNSGSTQGAYLTLLSWKTS